MIQIHSSSLVAVLYYFSSCFMLLWQPEIKTKYSKKIVNNTLEDNNDNNNSISEDEEEE